MQRMRAWVVVVGLVLALMPATPASATIRWSPRMGPAIDFAEQRRGSVSFAVFDTQEPPRFYGYRSRTRVPAASVIKVMFMVAYLRMPDVYDRPLRDSEKRLLRPMIIRSDNTAATRIADIVGPRRMNNLAKAAGMKDFNYTRPWGLSTTSARDQAWFMRRLPSYIPKRHEPYALYLLTRIVDSQRWGVGQVDTPRWSKHFKGGWGSGSGAVDHQVVRLQRNPARIGMAVMTTSSPSHDYGKTTLRGVFARLLADLP